MNAKLLVDKHYPAAWVFDYKPLKAGTIVKVQHASNLPDNDHKYWIISHDLQDDPYGILLTEGEYILDI